MMEGMMEWRSTHLDQRLVEDEGGGGAVNNNSKKKRVCLDNKPAPPVPAAPASQGVHALYTTVIEKSLMASASKSGSCTVALR